MDPDWLRWCHSAARQSRPTASAAILRDTLLERETAMAGSAVSSPHHPLSAGAVWPHGSRAERPWAPDLGTRMGRTPQRRHFIGSRLWNLADPAAHPFGKNASTPPPARPLAGVTVP